MIELETFNRVIFSPIFGVSPLCLDAWRSYDPDSAAAFSAENMPLSMNEKPKKRSSLRSANLDIFTVQEKFVISGRALEQARRLRLPCVFGDGFGHIDRRCVAAHVVSAYFAFSDNARDGGFKARCALRFVEPVEHQLRC